MLMDELCVGLYNKGAELGPRPEVTRGKPLDKWDEFLDPEGRVQNPEKIKEIVFRGVRLPSPLSSSWE